MTGSFDRNGRPKAARVAALGQMLVMAGALSACSSFSEQANPLNWFGDDSAPAASSADGRPVGGALPKSTPEGLPADSGNGRYAPPIRREVAPTRPLVRQTAPEAPAAAVASAPVAAAPSVAAAAAAPAVVATPAPAPTPAPTPAPSVVAAAPMVAAAPAPTFAQAQARAAQGPDAPPASVQMTPPPPADIPDTVPVPGRPRRLQAQYEQRLAESAQQVIRPGVVEPVAMRTGIDDTPIHLIDPATRPNRAVAARGGAGKALVAPPVQPAASFQVAAIDFGGGARLSAADLAAIAEVVTLYRQTRGAVIRVIGHAPAPLLAGADSVGRLMGGLDASQARANAVAAELHRRGVPAAKILVAADAGAGNQGGAQVFLDVM